MHIKWASPLVPVFWLATVIFLKSDHIFGRLQCLCAADPPPPPLDKPYLSGGLLMANWICHQYLSEGVKPKVDVRLLKRLHAFFIGIPLLLSGMDWPYTCHCLAALGSLTCWCVEIDACVSPAQRSARWWILETTKNNLMRTDYGNLFYIAVVFNILCMSFALQPNTTAAHFTR